MNKIALDEFMNFKFLSSLTFSPSGKKAAYIISSVEPKDKKDYVSRLRLIENGVDKPLVNDGKVGRFVFEDEEHILFGTERGKDGEKAKDDEYVTNLYRLPLDGGEAEKAYELPVQVSEVKVLPDGDLLLTATIDTRRPDMHKLKEEQRKKELEKIKDEKDYEVLTESPFWFNGKGMIQFQRDALFLYETKEKRLTRLTDKYMDVQEYQVRGDDVYFAGCRYRECMPKYAGVYHLNLKERKVTQLVKPFLMLMGMEFAGDKLILAGATGGRYGDSENPWFYALDLQSGELAVLNEADESMGVGLLTDVEYGATRFMKGDGDYVYFAALDRDRNVLKRIGLDGKIETVVSREGALQDWDVHAGEVIYMGMFGLGLPEIYRGNEQVTHWNTEVFKDKYLAQPNYIRTRVGEEDVDGWVLLPENYDPAGHYPAVLDIHGGPKCAYGPMFFHEMQYWAGKGYVVLFCNPHGSDGRGNDFAYLDLKWGSIDYEHVMAFVENALKAYPAIDPGRLCCTGGSYGGYMSNWILGHTDKFCCIATQRSVVNWVTMYGVGDIPPAFCGETCQHHPYSQEGFEQMWSVSPLKYVKNAKTPTLIIHSQEDHRCPVEEGYQLYTALKYLGVPSRMVVFKGENHELSRTGKPQHRVRRLKEITDWFDKYAGVK